jgi:hypothetical protein
MLFDKQYILTETITTETRYRPEQRTDYYPVQDPNTGAVTYVPYTYTVQVPYTYYTCTVELENFNLSHVPVYIMSEEQLSMYACICRSSATVPICLPDTPTLLPAGIHRL